MSQFHHFTGRLLSIWMVLYIGCLTLGLAKPLSLFIISCFDFAPTPYNELLNTLHQALLWLVPTAFLWIAYYLSNPKHKLKPQE